MRDVFMPADEKELRQRRIKRVMEICPRDFIGIVRVIGGIRIRREDIQIKKSHPRPRQLPTREMCVSVFLWDYQGFCWKIAKVRTQKQINRQYDPKVRGSLARTVLKKMPSLGSRYISGWIKRHTDRFDFIISKDYGKDILALLEVFLRVSLSPHY